MKEEARIKNLVDNRRRHHERKLPFYIVYCLPNVEPPYAGVTINPSHRMLNHKSKGRDTSDWFILDVCMTDVEAFKSERGYHIQGYGGAKDEGERGWIFQYNGRWIAQNRIHGKRTHIKSSKDKQVVQDALDEWRRQYRHR